MMIKKNLVEKIVKINTTFIESPPDENVKRCKNCNNELLVLSRQTRSADEGATTFYRCMKCCKSIKVG
jgi:DNA-directed RNA polymerase, subunit M/Transcription elongation factor TFIIS